MEVNLAQLPPGTAPEISFFLIEILVTLLTVAAAMLFPRLGASFAQIMLRPFRALAQRSWLAVTTVSLAALLLPLALLPVSPRPEPWVHDEFSYLLAADTFASGRITNPTPPLWQYFESFHIDLTPTYMSMYPPAQGLFLALGRILANDAWLGVVISAALLCGALCWMLQGWLPPKWALFGAALSVFRLAGFSYWVDSYYGGALAGLGGALLLGALPRLLKRTTAGTGLALATGIILLANTRPYEGFLLSATVVAILLVALTRNGKLKGALLQLTPATVLLLLGACLMGYYNFRVFGSPFTLPYKINRALYAAAPVFVWQHPYPIPVYRHAVMRQFYLGWELRVFNDARTVTGFLQALAQKVAGGTLFVLGGIFLPVLFTTRAVMRSRKLRPLFLILAVTAVGVAVNAFFMPHYLAPVMAALYLLMVQGLRHLQAGRRTAGFGRALFGLMPLAFACLFVLRVFAAPLHLDTPRFPMMWYGSKPQGLPRARIARRLAAEPGQHLVLVRYAPDHVPFDDWVYNEADIQASKTIWAREMDPAGSQALLRQFPGRKVWLVEPDAHPPRLTPVE